MKEMTIIPRGNGGFVIHLENFGYLLFEPLAKTNDNQDYAATLKIAPAMQISGASLAAVENQTELLKHAISDAICCMKATLDNIDKEVRTYGKRKV
jgi:hypothetical protein